MNISRISINDFGKWQNFQLDNLTSGLNVIYGRNGSGKTTIRHFLRGMLHGFDSHQLKQFLDTESCKAGSLEIESNHDRILLDHHRTGGVDEIRSKKISGIQQASAYTSSDTIGKVDPATFDQILNVGFRNQADDTSALATVLHSRFGVPLGRIEKPRVDEALVREREAVVVTCRERITELKRRREYLIGQISDRDHANATLRDDLTRQINALTDRIREAEGTIESMQRRVRDLDISIDELRAHIDRLRNQVETIRVERETNQLPELLARLDAIEQQIVRWKKVHQDVQGQRGKLRDEMVSWTSEDLADRELLPYEDVRKLLSSLEGRVGDLDAFLARFSGNGAPHKAAANDPHDHHQQDLTGAMQQTATSMREELYQLCRELNAQHQVYRRKTIVNELKQLRRCHVEVSDHIERLVVRRESVIEAIGKLDPARGELIRKNQHELCGCNYHDQYLAERQTISRPSYIEQRVEVDVSAELARLHQLEDDRRRLHADIGTTTTDMQDLIRRRDELIRRRDNLQLEGVETLRRDLSDVERRLSAENVRLEEALRQLEAARRVPEYRADPILENASLFLQRMTAGDLQQIWLAENGDGVEASDRAGRSIAHTRLSRSGKDQVRLSLSLAATQALHGEGIRLPLVLDDAMVNIDEQSQRNTAQVLIDYCNDGKQIIMFTCHRQVAGALAGPEVTVLDLPEYEQRGTITPPARFEQATARPLYSPLKYDHPTARTDVTLNLYRDTHAYDYVEPEQLTTRTLVDTAQYLDGDIRKVAPLSSEHAIRRRPTIAKTSAASLFDEATHLADTGLMGSDNIAVLRRLGVRTLGDLLNFDPTNRADELAEAGIDLDKVDAWQSQSLLLIAIPQLRGTDAVMLYNCGLTDIGKISSLNVDQLKSRVRDFADSTRGRRMFGSGYSYDGNQLGSWIDSARDNGDRYRNRRRWTHRGRSPLTDRHEKSFDRTPRAFAGSDSDNDRNDRYRSQRDAAPRTERSTADRPEKTREKSSRSSQDAARALKFYLELDNKIESAPSIGPRMAERMEKAGIVTVRDLLEETPENIATQLDYNRVKADDVRAWQQQATLVCRIPQLRGHDAQFLVACGVADPDKLASMDPEALYKVVGPFAKTREGQKICRSGKKPDLAEIKDWISWAQQTRALKAA